MFTAREQSLAPAASQVRSRKPEPPYCWQSKAALRRIRETFDATGNVASAIAVYCVLTEIASDEECETFQKPGAFIGFRAGLKRTTIDTVLSILREIGLIDYPERRKGDKTLRTPRTITLLPMPVAQDFQSTGTCRNNREETLEEHSLRHSGGGRAKPAARPSARGSDPSVGSRRPILGKMKKAPLLNFGQPTRARCASARHSVLGETKNRPWRKCLQHWPCLKRPPRGARKAAALSRTPPRG
jgi:hypothetical protein